MKQILYVVIFWFNIYSSLLLTAQNLPSKSLLKNLTVTLNYWQQINGFLAYNEKLPKDCKIENTINKRIIICPAWVKILINKKQLLNWQQKQNKNGFINLYLPKIGIMHEQAKITKIKKVIKHKPTNKNQQLVTAVYMRYANVLKYKIKDINVGKADKITATPEHKFYEITYKKFMAISKLGSDNTITNASNHHLKIICTNNRQNNCGTAPLNSLQKVYNIRVDKAHTYFVGSMKALVHNGCDEYFYKCKWCNEAHREKYIFSEKCFVVPAKKHKIRKNYQCEFCGMFHISITQVRKHKVDIHQNLSNEYECSLCYGKLKNVGALARHEAMHHKRKNKIFCRSADKFISLGGKLDKTDIRKFYVQPKSITEPLLRKRSRSPINDFLKNIDTDELPDFSNLDLPDLSPYIN